MHIRTVHDFRRAVREGSRTSLGCYPLAFLMADGEALCPSCAKAERRECLEAIAHGSRQDQWRPVALEVHWEGEPLTCAHCDGAIESAYGEPDDD
jgi:hypothetical protein